MQQCPFLKKKATNLTVRLIGGVEKWEDRKNFNFSPFCLVRSRKVKGWKK